jgi:hypothetical protein
VKEFFGPKGRAFRVKDLQARISKKTGLDLLSVRGAIRVLQLQVKVVCAGYFLWEREICSNTFIGIRTVISDPGIEMSSFWTTCAGVMKKCVLRCGGG